MSGAREPNDRLRAAIAAGGWSYDGLARAVRRVAAENGELLRTNKSAVAHWVAGARPAGSTAGYLVEALSRRQGRPLTPAAVGLADRGQETTEHDDPVSEGITLGRADLDRREFLRTAAFTTAGVAMPLDYDHDAVSRALAHQALTLKQPQHCTELIANALERSRGHLDGQTEALLHIMDARAYARTQRRPQAVKALLAAEDALTRVGAQQPEFSAVSGPAAGTVASHTARALTDLGDHRGTERQHRSALRKWDREKFRRVHVLAHAYLGDSLAAQARADEAIGSWNRSLDLSDGVTSARTRQTALNAVPILIGYERRGVAGAAELRERIGSIYGSAPGTKT